MQKVPLYIGTSKREITPDHAISLAGFSFRTGVYEGVDHRLYLRILVGQYSDHSSGRWIMVSADLLAWDDHMANRLRKQLADRWEISTSSVIFAATHTHSAPQSVPSLSKTLGAYDPDFLEKIEQQLLEGVNEAMCTMEQVDSFMASASCHIGMHRRKQTSKGIEMAPNPSGWVDPEVTVVGFQNKDGWKAAIVHYTCHPTTTGDNRISSEFSGVAMEKLERFIGKDAVSLFLQGCCGDIRPDLVKEGAFYRGDRKHVEQFGDELFHAAKTAIVGELTPLHPFSITSDEIKVPLDFEDKRFEHEQPVLSITYWHAFQELRLIAMNGEMVGEYGRFIKGRLQGGVKNLPIAYANGMLGYVPTSQQLSEGGYESRDSCPYFNLPSPFDSNIEHTIKNKLKEITDNEILIKQEDMT